MTATTAVRFTVTTEAGTEEFASRPKAKAAFHAHAVAGRTVHMRTAKGNVIGGYLAEQGPVEVVDGELRGAEVAEVAEVAADAAGAEELAQAVADGAVSFDAAAAALLSGNGAALVAELSAPTNDEAEWLAHVNADAPADEEPEAAQSTEEPREEAPVAEETPAAPEAPEQPEDAPAVASVRVPGRIVAFALARPDSYGAELRAALDARKATKDGSRTVKLAHALRAELLSVAQDVEMDARAAVKDGDIPAVSLVLAATALQTRVAGTL